jgi:hypothetical protein
VPALEIIASEIDRVLLPSDAEEAAFDLSGVEALRESRDAVVTRVTALVESDVLTLDEARAEVDYDEMPGGVGGQTLTAYRSQYGVAPRQAGAEDRMDADALESAVMRAVAEVLAPVVERLTQADARPAPRRLALERADDAPSSPSVDEVNAAYDELEGGARRTVQALAREQRERVLRDFDRLMSKPQRSAAWLDETSAHAASLARERTVTLFVPDPDVVPATRMSELGIASGPDGWEERIKVREIFDPRYWRRRTSAVLRPLVERAWQRGGATISGSFDLDEPAVSEALDARVEELAGQVTATTEAVLRSQLLAHGVAEGESVPELRARIQQVFTDLSGYRATMIARTESVGGYNAAAHVAALDAGATRKTWLSTDDTRTRRTHRAAQGNSVAMNKRFELTESRWPCDPVAPANQSIQCRCALTYSFEES